jgi:hypothetical protein
MADLLESDILDEEDASAEADPFLDVAEPEQTAQEDFVPEDASLDDLINGLQIGTEEEAAKADQGPTVDDTLSKASADAQVQDVEYNEYLDKLKQMPDKLTAAEINPAVSDILKNESDPNKAYQDLLALYEKADSDYMDKDEYFSELGEDLKVAYDVDVAADVAGLLPTLNMDYDADITGRLEIIKDWGERARAQLRLEMGGNYAIHKKTVDGVINDTQEMWNKYYKAGDKYGFTSDPKTGELKIKESSRLADMGTRFAEAAITTVTDGAFFADETTKKIDDMFVTNPNYDDDTSSHVAGALGQVTGAAAFGALVSGAVVATGGVAGAAGLAGAAGTIAANRKKIQSAATALPMAMLEYQAVYDEVLENTGGDKVAALEAALAASPGILVDTAIDVLLINGVITPISKIAKRSNILKSKEVAEKLIGLEPGLKDIAVSRTTLTEMAKKITDFSVKNTMLKGVGLGIASNAISEPLTELNSRAAVGLMDPNSVDAESTMGEITKSVDQGEYGKVATVGGITGGLLGGFGGLITSFDDKGRADMLQLINKDLTRLDQAEIEIKNAALQKAAEGDLSEENLNDLNGETDAPQEISPIKTKTDELADLIRQEADLRSQMLNIGDPGELAVREQVLKEMSDKVTVAETELQYIGQSAKIESIQKQLEALPATPDPETMFAREELALQLEELRKPLQKLGKDVKKSSDKTKGAEAKADIKQEVPVEEVSKIPAKDMTSSKLAKEYDNLLAQKKTATDPKSVDSKVAEVSNEIKTRLAPKIEKLKIEPDVEKVDTSKLEADANTLSWANKVGINLDANKADYLVKTSRELGKRNNTPNVNLHVPVEKLSSAAMQAEVADIDAVKTPPSYLANRKAEIQRFMDTGIEEGAGGSPKKVYAMTNRNEAPPIEEVSKMNYTKASQQLKSLQNRSKSGTDSAMTANPKAWDAYTEAVQSRVTNLTKTVNDAVLAKLSDKQKALVKPNDTVQSIEATIRSTRDTNTKQELEKIKDIVISKGTPEETKQSRSKAKRANKNKARQEGVFYSSKDESDKYTDRVDTLPERSRKSQTSQAPLIANPTSNADPVIEHKGPVVDEYNALRKKYTKIVSEKTGTYKGPMIGIQDVLNKLSDLAQIKVRWHNLSKDGSIAGIYNGIGKFIVTSLSNDLNTAGHEIGHSLSHQYGIIDDWVRSDKYDAELQKFWIWQSPTADPIYRRIEGVAEYFRSYLLNPKATEKLAPTYTAYIRANLPTAIMDGLMEAHVMTQNFINQSGFETLRSHIAPIAYATNVTVGPLDKAIGLNSPSGEWMTFMDRLYSVIPADGVIAVAVKYASKLSGINYDIRKMMDPKYYGMLMRTFQSKAEVVLKYGIVNPYKFLPNEDAGARLPYKEEYLFEGGIASLARHANEADMSPVDYLHSTDTVGVARRVMTKGLPMREVYNDLLMDPESQSGKNQLIHLDNELSSARSEISKYKKAKEEVPKELTKNVSKLKERIANINKQPANKETAKEIETAKEKLQRIIGVSGQFDSMSDVGVAEEALADFDKMPERVQEALNKGVELHREYSTALLDYAVGMDLLSQKERDSIIENNEEYYALGRILDDALDGQIISTQSNMLAEQKGSTRRIQSGILTLADRAVGVTYAGIANKLNQTCIDLFNPEVVGKDIIKSEIIASREKLRLEPLTPEELEKAALSEKYKSVFGRTLEGLSKMAIKLDKAPEGKAEKNQTLTIKRRTKDGEVLTEWWKIPDPTFYTGIRKLQDFGVRPIPIISSLMRMFKNSVTTALPFLLNNSPRDVGTRATSSRQTIGQSLKGTAKAIKETIKNRGIPDVEFLQRYSGDLTAWQFKDGANYYRGLYSMLQDEGILQKEGSLIASAKQWFQDYNPFFFQNMAESSERIGRLSGFYAAFEDAQKLAKNNPDMTVADMYAYAGYHTTKTLDFSNVNTVIRQIDQLTMFFSAASSKLQTTAELARDNPKLFAYKALVSTAFTVALQRAMAYMGDYEDELEKIPNYLRSSSIPIKLGPDFFAYIPLDYEQGFYHSVVNRMFDYMEGRKDSFSGLGENFMNTYIPFDDSANALAVLQQVRSNFDAFRDDEIVPHNEDDLKLGMRKVPKNASYVATYVHKMFIDAGMDDWSVIKTFGDARKLDFIAKNIGGTATSLALTAPDLFTANKKAAYIGRSLRILGPGKTSGTKDMVWIREFMKSNKFPFSSKPYQKVAELERAVYDAESSEEAEFARNRFLAAAEQLREETELTNGRNLISYKSMVTREENQRAIQADLDKIPSFPGLGD